MKKIILSLITAVAALFALIASAVVPQQLAFTIGAGSVTFTNNTGYAVSLVSGCQVFGVQSQGTGTNTFTLSVKRVSTVRLNNTSTNTVTYTNTLGSVTTAAAATTAALVFTNAPLYAGDKLVVTGAGTNTGTIVFDQLVYP